MARVRPAVYAALFLVLLVAASAAAAIPRASVAPLAAVGWPPSGGLVVAEVVTGGASASDEYVELANAGPGPADLAGLEVAYATSSGATVTKKAAWTASLVLEPGQHLLLANSSGVYASSADAVYSGGLAATGGAIVLRATGGAVADAVGWGDAANAFVEGTAAPAPAAGQSIERRPGGTGGNTVDTNSNSADFAVNAAPIPQNRAAAPVPAPTASPSPAPSETPVPTATVAPSASATAAPSETPTPSATPTPVPTPSATPTPSESPTPTATPLPTDTPAPSATPVPTPSATPAPTPAATASPTVTPAPTETPTLPPTLAPSAPPSPSPSPSAAETPSPMPSPDPVVSIAIARALSDGTTAEVEGVLTTALGALESGRTGFVQDTTGGIALYLDAAYPTPLPAGTWVRATGVVGSRYGQRTLRVAGADVDPLAEAGLPAPIDVATGSAGEFLEGWRLRVAGIVTEAPSSLADGLGVTVDDGSGPIRIVVAPDALDGAAVATGMTVAAIGPLGQRDSSGTGTSGYRLDATLPGEFTAAPTPSPTPTATVAPSPPPSPSATATATASTAPSPTATPVPSSSAAPSPSVVPTSSASSSPVPTASTSPSPSPTQTPAPTSAPLAIGAARALSVGAPATVRGVVIAEAGRIGVPRLIVIGDATGGLPIRIGDGITPPVSGTQVEVRGTIAAPYGQTELRVGATGWTVLGTAALPSALAISAGSVGEAVEGRLVTVDGTVTAGAVKSTGGDLVLVITGTGGATLKIYADASAGISPSALKKGLAGTFTGIMGQHASRKGALDGYRLWLRDTADVHVGASASPSPSASSSASPSASAAPAAEPIATARVRDGATVTVVGVVTAGRTLLDASGRRAVIEDATAAIELYLAAPDTSVRVGARLRVTGVIGRAWGAPRLHAAAVTFLGSATPAVHDLRAAPGAATEWRLVRVTGTVTSVHRTGDRWVAELDAGSATIPVIGLAGAGIPATALEAGRRATIVGIVRRPYPSASDRRFTVLPRATSDITLGAAVATASPGPSGAATSAGGGSMAASQGAPGGSGATSTGVPTSDLRDLAAHVGQRVRVGGLVTASTPDGFRLDDGTGTVPVVLEGAAADLASLVGEGDALDATGTVEQRDSLVLVVADPVDVTLVGDLGGGDPTASAVAALALSLPSGVQDLGVIGAPHDQPAAPGLPALLGALAALAGLGVAASIVARRLRGRHRDRARMRRRLAVWAGNASAQGPADA